MSPKGVEIKSLLVKFGAALAISLAGLLYSRLRNKRIKPSLPPPSPRSPDHVIKVDPGGGAQGHKGDLHGFVLVSTESLEEAYMQKTSIDNSMVSVSPSSRHSGDKDGFLLPEFNDLVKEFDVVATTAGYSPKKDVETPRSDSGTPKAFGGGEKDDYEQEVRQLRNMVRILREREQHLEVRLLEYYGLKEQETAVMELQNRLKINHMEAKLFTLKIESLQADNQRLEAQVADHAKVVTELGATRSKVKMLKKKLRSEAQQNKEQILTLQKRVARLQEQELKFAATEEDIQKKLQRLRDLEIEAEDLRKGNMRLQFENSELARRLDSTQILANSILEDPVREALKEESDHLRNENEDLKKEIERLQADRCADVEELVYLRWINACLRYELRNYQPPSGKTVARDLSKTLSPNSEEKAKQLILEYAHTEGSGEKGINIMDFDSDRWSSSQASYITDSGELDDSSVDTSSATRANMSSRRKFLHKLRRLIWGKDSHHHSHVSPADRSASPEDWDSLGCSSSSGVDMITDLQHNRVPIPQLTFRHSLDMQKLKSLKVDDGRDIEHVQRNSDVGSSGCKRLVLGGEGSSDLALENQLDLDADSSRKSELLKFAEALKNSRQKKTTHKKSASYSFG